MEVQSLQSSRLAPSPTGALHLGNARTFLVNWALARRNGWTLHFRMEDLDGPRVKPGAAEQSIDILHWLGIDWDGPIVTQSHDLTPYIVAMQRLVHKGLAYPCHLTRAQIESAASAPHTDTHEQRFPPDLRPSGPDRPRAFDAGMEMNWRFVVSPGAIEFVDGHAGPQRSDPSNTVGDFVIWTKRRQPAYQLAVVVDDARFGVTDIVRGSDLLDSAGRQLLLYRALKLSPEPRYYHLPLVIGEDGRRLAKRHGDTRLSSYREAGVRPERVVGLLAYWSGLVTDRQPMLAREFMERFRLDLLPHRPTVFSCKDHQWLLESSA